MRRSLVKVVTSGVTPEARAVDMLRVAAAYIRAYCQAGKIHYDEADCDGYCVVDDCMSAATELAAAVQGREPTGEE